MGEGRMQSAHRVPLVTREEDNDELFDSDSSSGSDDDDAKAAEGGHARRRSRRSSRHSSNSPLCELSSLMEQLPVKRGLSKYYQGKSQSFTSLAEVSCVEDLPKVAPSKVRTIKPCKSYAGGTVGSQMKAADEAPEAGGPCSRTTFKRVSLPRVSSCAALVSGGNRLPKFPVQKNLCLH